MIIDLFKLILSSPAGSFAFIAGMMLSVGWLIYWVTKSVTKIKAEHGHFNDSVKKMDTNIDDIRRDLSYLKGSIDIIKSGANPLTQSNSPITLSEKGKDVAEKLNADELIANNWDKIYANLESKICDKNAYDIQQYCIDTASVEPEAFFDKETILKLKNFAYKEGRPLQYYSSMLGVLIRDKYLEIKEIDVSEIDAHDPNMK